MATTDKDLQEQDAEYSAAFSEPEAEKPEVSEDEAFGLLPESTEDGSSTPEDQGEAPVVSITVDEREPDAVKEPAGDPGQPPGMTKEQQQEKSWEGRMRAREAELKAREEALKALEESLKTGKPDAAQEESPDREEPPAEEQAESAAEGVALSDVVKQVEDGDMTADEAMSQLSSDFGPEFAKAVSALVRKAALDTASKVVDEKVGAVNKSIDDLISGITDKSARDHFEAIAEVHPDFAEIADGEELKEYLASLPEDQKAKADKVIDNGSARQIIKLLNDVKSFAAANKQEEAEAPATVDPEVASAMDKAEGVRSKGLRIPEKPASASDDYDAAWNEF